jgi:uncharacterized membrane protein YtjA (UPF0391 family)
MRNLGGFPVTLTAAAVTAAIVAEIVHVIGVVVFVLVVSLLFTTAGSVGTQYVRPCGSLIHDEALVC